MWQNLVQPVNLPAIEILADNEGRGQSDLADNAGVDWPIVSLGGDVLHPTDLTSFSISVGSRLWPTLAIAIDNTDGRFDETNPDSLLDIWYADSIESMRHRSRWRIITIQLGKLVQITAEPVLTSRAKLWTANGTPIELLQTICREHGLGFCLGAGIAEGELTWLYQLSIKDALQHLLQNLAAANPMLWAWICPVRGLHIGDISKLIAQQSQVQWTNDPWTDTNAEGSRSISRWSPISQHAKLQGRPNKIDLQQLTIDWQSGSIAQQLSNLDLPRYSNDKLLRLQAAKHFGQMRNDANLQLRQNWSVWPAIKLWPTDILSYYMTGQRGTAKLWPTRTRQRRAEQLAQEPSNLWSGEYIIYNTLVQWRNGSWSQELTCLQLDHPMTILV